MIVESGLEYAAVAVVVAVVAATAAGVVGVGGAVADAAEHGQNGGVENENNLVAGDYVHPASLTSQ